MKRPNIIRYFLLTIVAACLILLPCMAAEDTPEPAVEILLDGGTGSSYTADREIAVQLDVIFHDMRWYNDELYLSYHIYDKKGELLAFEGERIKIEIGPGDEVRGFPVALDLADFPETEKELDAVIAFDIVDQKNAFWFSMNSEVNFQAASVIYNGHFPSRARSVVIKALHRPLILAVNLLACMLLGIGCYLYRKDSKPVILTGPFYEEGIQSLDRVLYERYFTDTKYLGHGCILHIGKAYAEGKELLPYTRFFAEKLKWSMMKEISEMAGNKKRQQIELCLIEGKEDVFPVLEQLKKQGALPKVVCFDFHGTDYDRIMEWSKKNRYRYDVRNADFVCLKKKNLLEQILY